MTVRVRVKGDKNMSITREENCEYIQSALETEEKEMFLQKAF